MFSKYCNSTDGDAKRQPSTSRQQSVIRSPSTPFNPSSSDIPMINQPSTSTKTFNASTKDTISPSSYPTESRTSATFQESNATGKAHCLIG